MTPKTMSTGKRPTKRTATILASQPETKFSSIVKKMSGKPGVTSARMFGSPALKTSGKVFAMLVKNKLVVKLPQERVTALVGSRTGEHFDPGHGRVMKEWVAVQLHSKANWYSLVEEAKDFVD